MTRPQEHRSGAAQFARYAFPPNELGYCGPAGADLLLESGRTGAHPEEITERARVFDGVWPYMEIIASAAGLDDPMDPRVGEAYWIGNELLDRVDPAACADELRSRFAGQTTSGLDDGPARPAVEAVPHHGFHVFTVYPWVRMLGVGNDAVAISVLDHCRIRWGEVTEIQGEYLQVNSAPLTWDGRGLALGPAQMETVRWSAGGNSLLDTVRLGQQVALHWDWACDELDSQHVRSLEHHTRRQLDETNRWLSRSAEVSASGRQREG